MTKADEKDIDYKSQAEEYLNNWKRERADFANYKKEELKRIEEIVKYGNEGIVLEVLDILDDLERAAKELKNAGLEQIVNKLAELLGKYGIEKIKVENKFDPATHEAISTEEDGNKVEEVRAGYTMYGKLIRPARVKIIK